MKTSKGLLVRASANGKTHTRTAEILRAGVNRQINKHKIEAITVLVLIELGVSYVIAVSCACLRTYWPELQVGTHLSAEVIYADLVQPGNFFPRLRRAQFKPL